MSTTEDQRNEIELLEQKNILALDGFARGTTVPGVEVTLPPFMMDLMKIETYLEDLFDDELHLLGSKRRAQVRIKDKIEEIKTAATRQKIVSMPQQNGKVLQMPNK